MIFECETLNSRPITHNSQLNIVEDKLHNDRLEEFLRKSLEGHSEAPPADLWSKIEANLEPPVVVRPRLLSVRGWWAVAAAAAVVGMLLVGQHLYFSGKINQMSRELERNSSQIKQLEARKLTGEPSGEPSGKQQDINGILKETEDGDNEAMEEAVATQNDNVEAENNQVVQNAEGGFAEQKKKANNEAVKPQSVQKIGDARKQGVAGSSSNPIAEQKKKANNEEKKTAPSKPNGETPAAENELVDVPKNEAKNANIPSELNSELVENQTIRTGDMPKVWPKSFKPLEMPELGLPQANSIVVASQLVSKGISIGPDASLMYSKLKISDLKHKPGPGPGPGPDPHKDFDSQRKISGQTFMAGVSVEKSIAPHVYIGTGVAYKKAAFQETHLLDLKFGEFDKNPHNDHEHNFEYNLNTAVGTVEMTVRAESTEPSQQIPDDEEVEAEVTTNQQLKYISMPVYAGYSLGNGRLRALVQAGFMLNFLQSSEFCVDSIKSLNPRFEFKRKEQQPGRPDNLQSVSVDYLASVGLEYQFSKSLSLRLTPTVVGSLTSRHNNPYIQSSELSAGLDMGVRYSF